MVVIDGSGLPLGRLASFTAKRLLNGERIDIVNAEKVVITGNSKMIEELYRKRLNRTTKYKGPYQPKMPDKFVKRAVRGMLPYKKERGAKALKRLRIWISVPEKYEKIEKEVLRGMKYKSPKKLMIGNLCRKLGWEPYE